MDATPQRRTSGLDPAIRWAVAAVWALAMVALALVANTGWLLGGPPFWLPTLVVPFVLPGAAALAAAGDRPRAVEISGLATAGTAVLGLVDLRTAPAMGVAELVLALAGALVTVAALLARRMYAC